MGGLQWYEHDERHWCKDGDLDVAPLADVVGDQADQNVAQSLAQVHAEDERYSHVRQHHFHSYDFNRAKFT